jgi:hypothetical protein
VLVKGVFDLGGADIFAPGNDHIFLAVHDMHGSGFVPDRQVAGVKKTVVDRGVGGFGLLVVAVEDDVRSHADFAHALVVHGDRFPGLVEHREFDPDPRHASPGAPGEIAGRGVVIRSARGQEGSGFR